MYFVLQSTLGEGGRLFEDSDKEVLNSFITQSTFNKLYTIVTRLSSYCNIKGLRWL